MQLKLKGRSGDKIQNLVNTLKSTINSQGESFGNAEQTTALLSLESLAQPQANAVATHFDEVAAQIGTVMSQIGFESFDESTPEGKARRDVALSAGAVAAMAVGNPLAYAQKAYGGVASPEAGVTLVEPQLAGAAGRMDYRDRASMEAFDDRELREHLPYSIAFNIFASRQDEFSERFYPTTVVTPDQAGLDVSVSRMLVFNEVKHAVSGKAANFAKKNLIDAAVDASILADESTRLVPVVLDDDSNAAYFVPEAVVAASVTKIAGVDVPTAPLVMNKEVDLLGISQYAPLIGAGLIDNTDSVDARVVLAALYLQITDDAAGYKFNTSRLARSAFVKSVEGNYREMNLQFSTRDLILDKDSKAVDNSANAAFAGIVSGQYTVRVAVDVNGVLNVETGTLKVYASGLTVASITDSSGNDVSTSAGAGATIKAAVEACTIAGYDLQANRTNANRRTRGHLIDTTVETERYTIPLGSPLSVPSPASSQRDAADLKALITAARLRNSNNAVTALLNYADSLKAYVKGPKRKDIVPAVQGMGRYLVEPFFEEHTLDMLLSTNSIKSHEKAADITSVLVNAIRDVAYRMYRDSKYQAALDALSGGAGETPTLLVGTDQVLVRHLIVSGDTRTFGTAFEKAAVVASLDRRMAGKIVLSFARDKADGPDPLTFGAHAWIPELTSSVMVNRNGATIKEAMVQPRTLHINNLPVMAVINVINLSQVLADRVKAPVTGPSTANPYLDGLTTPAV